MSWLHQIIASFSKLEIEKIQNFKLRGKEKLVFNYHFKIRNKKPPEIEAVCKQFEISRTHYYKINSVLISKITKHLFGSDKLQMLQWLKYNGFFAIFKVELQSINAAFWAGKDIRENKFYLKCFHLCINVPYEIYDKAICISFGKLYLNTIIEKSDADENYVKYHLLFADCNRFSASRNPHKSFNFNVVDYIEKEVELLNNKHFLALYYLYRTFISHYSFYDEQPLKALSYIKKAIKLKNKIAHFFDIDVGVFLELSYADILLNNNLIEDAHEKYRKIFSAGISTDMFGYYYHAEQYAISAICTERLTDTEHFLNSVFNNLLPNAEPVNVLRGLLCYAKLSISQQDYKKAIHYINLAYGLNNKSFYLPFDLQLRVLENACFLLKKDFDFAKQLAYRNLKFTQALPSKKNYNDIAVYFKLISTLITLKLKHKKLTANNIKVIEKLKVKFAPVYGNLLNYILHVLD